MLCNRVFDFVTGSEIPIPPPSDTPPRWDIVRPNETAEELLARHARALGGQASSSRRPDPSCPPARPARPRAGS